MRGHPRPRKAKLDWGEVEDLCREDRVEPYRPMKTVRGSEGQTEDGDQST
jgi:hypothetical protein